MKHYWDERELDEWFNENHLLLGFSKIKFEAGGGDYVGWRDGKKFIIELEQTTSQFFLHKPEMRSRIDIIICWHASVPVNIERRKELSEKEVIEIKPFVLGYR